MLAARGSWPKGAARHAILHALLDLSCRVSMVVFTCRRPQQDAKLCTRIFSQKIPINDREIASLASLVSRSGKLLLWDNALGRDATLAP